MHYIFIYSCICIFCCAASSSTVAPAVLGAMPTAIPELPVIASAVPNASNVHGMPWLQSASTTLASPAQSFQDALAWMLHSASSQHSASQCIGYKSCHWARYAHNSQVLVGKDPTMGICRHGRASTVLLYRRCISVQPYGSFYVVSWVQCSSLEAKMELTSLQVLVVACVYPVMFEY